jgi:hypothetical protein
LKLFTPATNRALHFDAYLIDTRRTARPLRLVLLAPPAAVIEALLDRIALMGKSVYGMRNRTFALFFRSDEGEFVLASTGPFHDGVQAALRDTLAAFGEVEEGEDFELAEGGLSPLLAYERGSVSLFDVEATRPWLSLAGRRGMRILGATTTDHPDPDVFVEEQTAEQHLRQDRVEDVELDLDAAGEMSEAELERYLDDQLGEWEAK